MCHVCHSPPPPTSPGDPKEEEAKEEEVPNKAMIIELTKVSSVTLLFPILSVVLIGTRKLAQLPPYLPYIGLNVDTNVALFTIWWQKVIFRNFMTVVHCVLF